MASRKDVPVVPYTKNSEPKGAKPTQKVLGAYESGPDLLAAINGGTGRKAVAYNRCLSSELTPTLRSFTLEGKVAVVTG